jgi:hypothetical protein
MDHPSSKSLQRMKVYTQKYWEKTGTSPHPENSVTEAVINGLPITEYLPEGHEGRQVYGLVTDPTPDKGREARHKVASG